MKLSVPGRMTTLLGNLAKKHKISITGYPISHEVTKDAVYVTTYGTFNGDKTALKSFYKDLKKDKRTISVEIRNNLGIVYIKQNINNKHLFQPGIVFVKPAVVTQDGVYIFELAAWEKSKLIKIIKAYKKIIFGGKLHWIKQKKIKEVQVLSVFPNLSEQQKKCFQLAVDKGYYDVPRKIYLEELADIAKISYSTYQFHLRTAEKKIMPSLGGNIK